MHLKCTSGLSKKCYNNNTCCHNVPNGNNHNYNEYNYNGNENENFENEYDDVDYETNEEHETPSKV